MDSPYKNFDDEAEREFREMKKRHLHALDLVQNVYVQSVHDLYLERSKKIARIQESLAKRMAAANPPKLIKVQHGMVLFA